MTTVTDARKGEERDLAQVITELQERSSTGTLKLSAPDGVIKYIYVKKGTVELLKTNRSRTLLGKALLKRRRLTEEQLRSALERQKAASSKLRLGEILVGMGIVLERDVHQALAFQIAEELFELFGYATLRSEFFRGEPPLDIFEPEDLQARVSLSPIQLTHEAIRRHNELVELRRALPSQRDVYALTPQAYARAEAEQNQVVQEVVSTVDGHRTLAELVDASRAPDLAAMRVVAKLVHDGDAVRLSAQELLELGQLLEERAEYERARERYLRAEELEHPDFDLPRRIGQIAEALGDLTEACARYVAYADACARADYTDVATLTLARVLELDPQHALARQRHTELTSRDARAAAESRERQVELLVRNARALTEAHDPGAREKTLEAGALYEELLADAQAPEEQRRLLAALVALLPERDDLRERMAEASLALGDPGQAVQELLELALEALEAEQLDKAVARLQRILEIDADDLIARQSLAVTYARMGHPQDAVREYLRLTHTLTASGLAVASAERMVQIYEKVTELDPGNVEAQQFLALAYDGKKEAEKAIGNYTRMLEGLRAKGSDAEVLPVLEKLVALRPLDAALALERARLLRKLGRGGEALDALRGLGEAAGKQGDAAGAQSFWGEVLAQAPGDLDAHLAVARLEEKDKQHAAAVRRLAAVFELALVAGRDAMAEDAIKRIFDIEPDPQPEHRERMARILALRGRKDEAARALVRAARRARDDENLGLAKALAQRALEQDGACADARDLLEALKRPPAAAPVASEGPRIHATITGGGVSGPSAMPSIDGGYKQRKIGKTADRLKQMAGGGGPAAPEAPPASASRGPEAPGEAAEAHLSKKASSAMNKLRALKSGGGAQPPSSDQGAPLSAGAAAPPPTTPISKGPEGPGAALDEGVAKKASSAMNKLRALKSGGGSGGGSPGPEAASTAAPPAQPVPGAGSQAPRGGPEAPGEAVDDGLAKKASSAMNKLRALKAGGGAAPEAAAPPPTTPISKGPEAPGEAVDDGLAKKASSAMSKLRALKSGGGGAPAPEAAPATPAQPISKGPEAPGEAVDDGVAKKASSAMNKLRALKSGGGAPAPEAVPAQPVSGAGSQAPRGGPEAPGEAVDGALSRKAGSAMSKLRALKSGGGAAPADAAPATPTQPLSKGPEAPGEALDQGLAKKASSAMSRLKALKAAGGARPAAPPPSDAAATDGSGETISAVGSEGAPGEGAP